MQDECKLVRWEEMGGDGRRADMTSGQYTEGFEGGMSSQRRQIESEDFFDRTDDVAGFAAGR